MSGKDRFAYVFKAGFAARRTWRHYDDDDGGERAFSEWWAEASVVCPFCAGSGEQYIDDAQWRPCEGCNSEGRVLE